MAGLGFASVGSSKRFIRVLLGDSDFAAGASLPKTAINKEPAQVPERLAIYLRRAERRVGAGRWIQHPTRHYDDLAKARLDEAQPRPGPYLAVLQAQAPAVQRMPAIMNLDLSPNTGRMNGRSRSGARTTCSPARMKAAAAPLSCTRSSRPLA
jgi:hypothetical protein